MFRKMIFLTFLIVSSIGCSSKSSIEEDIKKAQANKDRELDISIGCLVAAKNIIQNYNFKANPQTRKELVAFCEYVSKDYNYIIESYK